MKSPAKMVLIISASAWMAIPIRAQDGIYPPPASGEGAYVPPPGYETEAPPSTAADGTSFQTFYDSLASQGKWIESADYGYVWQPSVSDLDWAPYTVGHWVYTDDGWTWASEESWGWATYHYGRWVNLDGVGWCWVPGYTWAPAWVSWRYGDGYCGWAPLPPDSFLGIDYLEDGFSVDAGFHIGGDCDSFYGIGAGWYNFVPVIYLGYPSYRGHYARRNDNFAIINHTTNVTNINVTRNGANSPALVAGVRDVAGSLDRVTTGGPSLDQVNAVSQTPIEQVRLVRANQPGVSAVMNHTLALYAPRLNPATSAAARPAFVAGSLDRLSINRGADITRPLAVNQRLLSPAPTASEIELAQRAQFDAPARAKVITAKTAVQPILEAPLVSLKSAMAEPATTVSRPQATIPNAGPAAGYYPGTRPPYAYPDFRPQVQAMPEPYVRPAPAAVHPTYLPSASAGSGNSRSPADGGIGPSAGSGRTQGTSGPYGGGSGQQKNH